MIKIWNIWEQTDELSYSSFLFYAPSFIIDTTGFCPSLFKLSSKKDFYAANKVVLYVQKLKVLRR